MPTSQWDVTQAPWPDGVGLQTHDCLDSTSAEARRLAAAGVSGPLWIWARRQTDGRGRRGRAWRSTAQDLTATLLLRPHALRPSADPAETATLSFAAALAVADVVEAVAPQARIALKWPNDVLVEDRKIAGVLLEGAGEGPSAWLSIGVGLNLVATEAAADLEPDATPPIALDAVASRTLLPDEALRVLASALQRWLSAWRDEGFAPIRAAWRARAARLGETVIARLPTETLSGVFADLDHTGALVLDMAGDRRRISAAEVFFP